MLTWSSLTQRIITPFSVKQESLRLHESLVKVTGKLRLLHINNLKLEVSFEYEEAASGNTNH